ncbi:MAG: hypothetical protein WD847_17390 [Pirellulales bacterium]
MSAATTERSRLGAEKDVYSFTLLLEGVNEITDDLERVLYDAGCDDALLSASEDEVSLDFDREASSMFEAIRSAIHAVETCGLPIRVRRVVPPGHHAIRMMNNFLELRDEQPDLVEELRKLNRG